MKPIPSPSNWISRGLTMLLLGAPLGAFALPVITLANFPLFLAPPVNANIMIMFDNSESMDGTMAGKMLNGDDPATRGNIARGVLRSVLSTYQTNFNWGLSTFEVGGDPALYVTYQYFLGTDTTMVYTNDCNATGVSPSNANLRCLPNPERGNGFAFITYEKSGNDVDVNDVWYGGYAGQFYYGIGQTGRAPTDPYYAWYFNHLDAAGSGFAAADFAPSTAGSGESATDAGWVPDSGVLTRQLFIYPGWGFVNWPTGRATVLEDSQADNASHFAKLMQLLGNETQSGPEIKNDSIYTPLAGSLASMNSYFSDTYAGHPSPISQTCQKNFVVLATDGFPTAKYDGAFWGYKEAWTNVKDSSGIWTYGIAQQQVFDEITALRTTIKGGTKYDVMTYVIGMGDAFADEAPTAGMDKMASLGGGYPTAFKGNSVASLTNAFQSIVADIQAKTSAAASVALNSGSWNGSSAVYQAKFSSTDWSGDLLAFSVAASGVMSDTPAWSAAAQVKAQDWSTGRQILTYKPSAPTGSQGIAFRWPADPATPSPTELDLTQITALNTNSTAVFDGYGAQRLTYLRGDKANEALTCPTCTPQFRSRPITPLGDIVNSSPYYVGAPNFGYYDDMESAPYSAFVSSHRNRTPTIYAGANDGMLHAFNAATGAETLAYVPSALYSELSQLGDTTYSHRYFVDGSPVVGDVFYGGNWHSLLVSGMRAGGQGLFAIDVTDPGAFSETNAASLVRWEFHDDDMGYIFGQPLLVKTNYNGRWAVVVSGGYNAGNASGHAFLFIIDAETGQLLKKIDTGAGSAASPNGLSAAAAVDTNGDNVADVVYAGDLDGNLWKFDISAAAPASWARGNGGLPLFRASSGQSITSRPDVTKFPTGGYIVAFGTGRYLASADTSDGSSQSEYGVRDRLVPLGETVLLSELQQQFILQTTSIKSVPYRLSTHEVGPPSDPAITGYDNTISRSDYLNNKKGWFVNLPSTGERMTADPRFRGGRVVMTSFIPDISDPCSFGGDGWVMEYDAITGNRLDTPTFDTNGDNTLGSNDNLPFLGYGTQNASGRLIKGIPANPGFMGNQSGNTALEDKYINTSNGTVVRVRETAGRGGQGRVMWREVK